MQTPTLIEADKTISKDRQDAYGNPEDSFTMVSNYWNAYLANKNVDVNLDEKDVALMMALLKVARIQGQGFKRDNAVDACGYLAIFNDRLQGEELTPMQADLVESVMKHTGPLTVEDEYKDNHHRYPSKFYNFETDEWKDALIYTDERSPLSSWRYL